MGNEYNTPTQTTAPVANTTAGLWTFTAPAGFLYLCNLTGQTVYLRFNSSSAAAVATHDYMLLNNTSASLEAEDLGVGNFATVSGWFPTSATVGSFYIRGI